jgi:hypothetical protein
VKTSNLTRHRCVDNIKLDLWGGVEWIGLVLDRDEWMVLMNEVKMNICASQWKKEKGTEENPVMENITISNSY